MFVKPFVAGTVLVLPILYFWGWAQADSCDEVCRPGDYACLARIESCGKVGKVEPARPASRPTPSPGTRRARPGTVGGSPAVGIDSSGGGTPASGAGPDGRTSGTPASGAKPGSG